MLESIKLRHALSVSTRHPSISRAGLMHRPFSRKGTIPIMLDLNTSGPHENIVAPGDSSERNQVDATSTQASRRIHVFTEVSVEISDNSQGRRSTDVELTNLATHPFGNHSEAGVAVIEVEKETWVDRLMTITLNSRRRPYNVSRGRA